MEKGYYEVGDDGWAQCEQLSQSTIKMEKGYYCIWVGIRSNSPKVAIHNKNGKGLLPAVSLWA